MFNVSSARITGRSHASSNVPCQDYVLARNANSVGCIALADGAGSRSMSGVGALVSVKAVTRVLCAKFDHVYQSFVDDSESARKFIYDKIYSSLMRASKKHACVIDDLACTILFVAQKGSRFLAGHIGDGVIVISVNDSMPYALSLPDNGEYANITTFVTDKHAYGKFRLYSDVENSNQYGFILMSDGTAESLYDKRSGSIAPAATKLLSWNHQLARKTMTSILAENLKNSISKKSSDDCSIAIMSSNHCS